jgi:hypothetical protein
MMGINIFRCPSEMGIRWVSNHKDLVGLSHWKRLESWGFSHGFYHLMWEYTNVYTAINIYHGELILAFVKT